MGGGGVARDGRKATVEGADQKSSQAVKVSCLSSLRGTKCVG